MHKDVPSQELLHWSLTVLLNRVYFPSMEDGQKAELLKSYFASVFSHKGKVVQPNAYTKSQFKMIKKHLLILSPQNQMNYTSRILKEPEDVVLELLMAILKTPREHVWCKDWRQANILSIFKKRVERMIQDTADCSALERSWNRLFLFVYLKDLYPPLHQQGTQGGLKWNVCVSTQNHEMIPRCQYCFVKKKAMPAYSHLIE